MQGEYEIKGFKIMTHELLGEGANGKVFICQKMDQPELKLCAKVIEAAQKDLAEAELVILKKLSEASRNCPNVVKTYLAEYVEKLNKIVIIMELCESDLEKAIKKNKFPEPQALQIFKQLVLGYKFIYENCIIHRDLKPANILIQGNLYKIADFGEGKIIDRNKQNKLTKRGSPVYQAPELFESDDTQVQATDKLDVFSLGVMFYEILYGELPQEKERKNISQKSLRDFIIGCKQGKPIYFPAEPKINYTTKQLIEKMLQVEPKNRIGWEDIFKHQYFQITTQTKPQPQNSMPKPNPPNQQFQQPIIVPNQQPTNPPNQQFQQPTNPPNQQFQQPIIQPPQRFSTTAQGPQTNQQSFNKPQPPIPTVVPTPGPKIVPNNSDQSMQQLQVIINWISDMQRIIEEKCNELLGKEKGGNIIKNLTKYLEDVKQYYNNQKQNNQLNQNQRDTLQQFFKDIYTNLSQHLQILQFFVIREGNTRYSKDYLLFYKFLQNLSLKKYNFENPQLLIQQIQQDEKEIESGRNSQQQDSNQNRNSNK